MRVLIFLIIIIIGLYFLQKLKKTKEDFQVSKNKTPEKPVDAESTGIYIENGSFAEGKGIPNSIGTVNGNNYVPFNNPGESSYVLRMGPINKQENPKGQNGYLFKVKLPPGKTYRISLFNYNTKDYMGGNETFRIRQYLTNGKNRLFMSEGSIVSSQTVGEDEWTLRDYVFTLEPNGNETVDIIIAHNAKITAGYKYITRIKIDDFTETLTTFPVRDGLLLYLNALNIRDPTDTLVDYTGKGGDFKTLAGKLMRTTKLYGVNLYKEKLTGPPSNSINMKSNEWSVSWFLSAAARKKTSFLRIYANNKVQHGLEIYYMPEKGTGKNKIFIHYRNNEYDIDVGVIKSFMPFVLTYSKAFFVLYLNGSKIWRGRYRKSRRENRLNIEDNVFTTKKNMTINDSGLLIGGFISMNIFNRALNKMEVRKVSDYYNLEYAKIRNNDVFKNVVNKEMNKVDNLNKYCGPYSKDNPVVKELKVVDLDLCPKWNPNPDPKKWVRRDNVRCWGCNY